MPPLMTRCLICCLAVAAARSARAYTLNGGDPSLRGWYPNAVAVSSNLSECPEPARAAIENSLFAVARMAWSSVPGVRIALNGGASSATSAREAMSGTVADSPLLLCDTSLGKDASVDAGTVPALTGILTNKSTKEIVYGFTLLNAQPGAAANIAALADPLLAVVLTHEMGHLLGLGHSSDSEAIMFFDVTGKTSPALAPDDIAGLRHLYAQDRPASDNGAGCAPFPGVVHGGSGNGPLGGAVLLIGAVALLRFRGRRMSR